MHKGGRRHIVWSLGAFCLGLVFSGPFGRGSQVAAPAPLLPVTCRIFVALWLWGPFSHDDLALVAYHSTASSNGIVNITIASLLACIVHIYRKKQRKLFAFSLPVFLSTPLPLQKADFLKKSHSTHRDIADITSDEVFPSKLRPTFGPL